MTSRELVIRAMTQQECPRVPREMLFGGTSLLAKRFPSDVGSPAYTYGPGRSQGVYGRVGRRTDIWGCVWETQEPDVSGEVRWSPLYDWANLDAYRPPYEVLESFDPDSVTAQCEASSQFMIAQWDASCNLFERMQHLRGTETLFYDLAYGEKEVYRLRDMVHEFFLRQEELWVGTGVDAIHIADDWGTQRSLLISPEMWRAFFKPCYREYCDMAHRHGKLVLMHSDGFIRDILEDLIEIGVDAVNSQLQCMEPEELESRFGGRICFWGEIDRQYLLPFGTPEENREAVRKIGETLYLPRRTGVVAQCAWGKDMREDNLYAVFDEWERLNR